MTKITINDTEYETEDLSENARAQLTSLQFVTTELEKLGAMTAALQTARNAYSNALQLELEEPNS
jgi:hypothetical protein